MSNRDQLKEKFKEKAGEKLQEKLGDVRIGCLRTADRIDYAVRGQDFFYEIGGRISIFVSRF